MLGKAVIAAAFAALVLAPASLAQARLLMHLKRRGDIRHCQGTLLVNWVAMSGDGQERGTGMNVFTLDAGGKITSVIGFWDR